MSLGADLAAEIAAAVREAGAAVGNGPLIGQLLRRAPADTSVYPVAPGAETALPVAMVLTAYSDRDRDGTTIRAGDVKVMIEAGAVEPSTSDRLTVGGRTYSIEAVKAIQPGGVVLYWEVQARGA